MGQARKLKFVESCRGSGFRVFEAWPYALLQTLDCAGPLGRKPSGFETLPKPLNPKSKPIEKEAILE